MPIDAEILYIQVKVRQVKIRAILSELGSSCVDGIFLLIYICNSVLCKKISNIQLAIAFYRFLFEGHRRVVLQVRAVFLLRLKVKFRFLLRSVISQIFA